ncbi:MAG: 2-hydroxychromene-2-carboxylate isomerase [Gammaproteobacteria bacterium]
MTETVDVKVFFNFRSPYCYLVSKSIWQIFDDYHTNLEWRPFGGWDGRSPPERAKVKIPLVRQDIARWTKRMGIPFNPPPPTTDPTKAGAGSLLAEEKGLLREYITEVMHAEWGEGLDIGQDEVLLKVGEKIGLDRQELAEVISSKSYMDRLDANNNEATESGVIGVPTFVVGDQIFWGNDRLDFVLEYLTELGLKRS